MKGEIILALPRVLIHQYNILHSGIGAILFRGNNNDIYVHQRSSSKRIFPSKYDMFIGGVCQAGESTASTLLRELNEECGIDLSVISNNSNIEENMIANIQTNSQIDYNIESKLTWSKAADLAWERWLTKQNNNKNNENLSKYSNLINNDNKIIRLGETVIRTSYNQCVVDCYIIILSEEKASNIYFADGEIAWGKWMSLTHLQNMLEGQGIHDFVPDGMQVISL
eukprot:gene8924-12034_t